MKAYKGKKSAQSKSHLAPSLLRSVPGDQTKGSPQKPEAKYATILLELIKPFYGPAPQIDEVESLLNAAMIAWNIANMKKLMPVLGKTMLRELKKDFIDGKDAILLIEKLIRKKEQKYGDYDLFIDHFNLLNIDEAGKFNVTVSAKPIASFLPENILSVEDMEGDFEEDDFDDEEGDDDFCDFQQAFIDRNALALKPRQPFFDWLKTTVGGSLPPWDTSTIYLIEDLDNYTEIGYWLKKNFDYIFTKELGNQVTDRKKWPAKRSYKMFTDWFEFSVHLKIYDLEEYPVVKG